MFIRILTFVLSNYQTPFRKDRGPNKSGGGVILYVKDNINVSRRDDLDFDDLEGIWAQIKINGKQILFGILYIPPKSTQDIWEKLESSIEMSINDTAIDDVIITGDFNDNQLDYSRTKISFLLTKFSLLQMIFH